MNDNYCYRVEFEDGEVLRFVLDCCPCDEAECEATDRALTYHRGEVLRVVLERWNNRDEG